MRRLLLTIVLLLSCFSFTACSKIPDTEQIKADLIGQGLTSILSMEYGMSQVIPVWEFHSISEFQDFSIKSIQQWDETVEYDVTMRLKELTSNQSFLADALITYRKTDSGWELISIRTKLFRPL